MKEFRCLVGLRNPPRKVALAIRDLMPEIAPVLEHVEEIRTIARVDRRDGGASLVNAWRVNPPLPPAISAVLSHDKLGWLDHAEWSGDLTVCHWRIETNFMDQAIDCSGVTRFEPAMGGRGTRALFAGQLDIDPAALSAIPLAWRGPASLAVEMLIGTIIPKNFRKTAEAIGVLLDLDSVHQRPVMEAQSRIGHG
jgi:hypothetical protein